MATRTANRLAWNSTAAITENAFATDVLEDKVLAHDDGSVGFLVTYTKANTDDQTKTVFRFAEGDFWRSDLGTLTVALNTTTSTSTATSMKKFIGPFESARFKDSSGYLNWKVSRACTAGATTTLAPVGSGTVSVFQMPGKVEYST